MDARMEEARELAKQAREAESLRRDLINYKELYLRSEAERQQFRGKASELENRIGELSDLLNMEL